MKRFIATHVEASGRWLLLNQPELYVMRLHIVLPAAFLVVVLAMVWARMVSIHPEAIPNPEMYGGLLLVATVLGSAYWIYLQNRQASMLPFRYGVRGVMSGTTAHISCLVCLLVINSPAFVLYETLSPRIAAFAVSETEAHGLPPLQTSSGESVTHSDLQVWQEKYGFDASLALLRASSGWRLLGPAEQSSIANAVVILVAVEIAAFASLIRSLSMNRTFLALVVALALVFVSALITLPTAEDSKAFILTCLLVYAFCATRLVLGTFGPKLSHTTAAAVVICVLGAPLLPLAYTRLRTLGSDSESLFVGAVFSLMVQPLFQNSLNRFRAAPG